MIILWIVAYYIVGLPITYAFLRWVVYDPMIVLGYLFVNIFWPLLVLLTVFGSICAVIDEILQTPPFEKIRNFFTKSIF